MENQVDIHRYITRVLQVSLPDYSESTKGLPFKSCGFTHANNVWESIILPNSGYLLRYPLQCTHAYMWLTTSTCLTTLCHIR